MATDISVNLARLELREILLHGSETWNQWRKENPNAFIDLFGVNLREANLFGADLHEANLRGANLLGANLHEVDLRGANLHEVDLRGAILHGAILREAILSRANLRRADLHQADLRRVNLFGSILSRANLRKTTLFGANLRRATLFGASLHEADLRGANLRGANLRGTAFYKATLRGADLHGADLRGATLHGADLRGADLRGADLRGADLREVKLLIEETFKIKVFDEEIEPSDLKELKTAIASYTEAVGYTDPEILSERYGSFFSDIRYKIAKTLTPEVIEKATREGEDLYRRGTANLKAQLEKTGVKSTQKLVNATAELLKAVEPFNNVVLTFGKLIIIKHTAPDGKTQTIVRTVSTEIQNQLESTPHILDAPNTLLAFLQGETMVPQDTPLSVVPEERRIESELS